MDSIVDLSLPILKLRSVFEGREATETNKCTIAKAKGAESLGMSTRNLTHKPPIHFRPTLTIPSQGTPHMPIDLLISSACVLYFISHISVLAHGTGGMA